MDSSTDFPGNFTTHCPDCENSFIPSNSSKLCYPWVAQEFVGRNFTLDDVNAVVFKRSIPGIIFLSCVILLGLLGNGHVLYVFSRRKYKSNYIQDRIHANYRIFILWLSILSVIQCAVVSPLLIVYLAFPVTYPSDVLCRIFRFVLYLVPLAMSLTLIAIAVDRYLVICKTFNNRLTPKHSKLMCLVTLIVALVLACPALYLFGKGKTETGIPGLTGYRCYLGDEAIVRLQEYYQAILILIFFVVLIVLFILYTKVQRDYRNVLRFRRTSRRYSASTPEAFRQSQEKLERQRLWIYGYVTIGYVVSAFPYHILAILWFVGVIKDCDLSLIQSQMFYLFIWSYFINPVINPIIYGFQDDGFRYSVEAIYRHSKDSFRKYLFDRNSSNANIANGTAHSDADQEDCQSISGIQMFTDISDIGRSSADIRPRAELNGIITSIASVTLQVSRGTIQEDINRNTVHM